MQCGGPGWNLQESLGQVDCDFCAVKINKGAVWKLRLKPAVFKIYSFLILNFGKMYFNKISCKIWKLMLKFVFKCFVSGEIFVTTNFYTYCKL